MTQANPTRAFITQTWISFGLAIVLTAAGIVWLPVDIWAKAFVGVGFLFTVSQAFVLAKTVRDEHESQQQPQPQGTYRHA